MVWRLLCLLLVFPASSGLAQGRCGTCPPDLKLPHWMPCARSFAHVPEAELADKWGANLELVRWGEQLGANLGIRVEEYLEAQEAGRDSRSREDIRQWLKKEKRLSETLRFVYWARCPFCVEPLRKLLLSDRAAEEMRYLAAIALEQTGAADEFLFDLMNGDGGRVAFYSILALGTRDDPEIRGRIDELWRTRRDREDVDTRNLISSSSIKIRSYWRSIARYASLVDDVERMEFLATLTLSSGRYPVMNFFSLDRPERMWALKKWIEFGKSNLPVRLLHFYQEMIFSNLRQASWKFQECLGALQESLLKGKKKSFDLHVSISVGFWTQPYRNTWIFPSSCFRKDLNSFRHSAAGSQCDAP